MISLTKKRLKTIKYSIQNNGISLSEASHQIYTHKSSASKSLKTLEKAGYLKEITDTPVNTKYRKIWLPTEKAEKIIKIIEN